jgi:hypothetical protein
MYSSRWYPTLSGAESLRRKLEMGISFSGYSSASNPGVSMPALTLTGAGKAPKAAAGGLHGFRRAE